MKRILIVDDEFLIRYTLEEGLRDRGHDTASVASVEEALEYVKKYLPNSYQAMLNILKEVKVSE